MTNQVQMQTPAFSQTCPHNPDRPTTTIAIFCTSAFITTLLCFLICKVGSGKVGSTEIWNFISSSPTAAA
jgi:hypothetical protein